MGKWTRVAVIDPEKNPLFQRMFGEDGFSHLCEDDLDAFLAEPGLKMVLFAEDPNLQKETMDIVVIGPELKKAFGANLAGGWFAELKQGRALGARWGIKRLPAIALFRGKEFLGAAEGLMGWEEYCAKLQEISTRTQAPRRTISIIARQ